MPAASTACREYTIFFRLVLPLVRPALATVAVFTMIPIWNDLWFPLILAPGEATKTVTLGAQVFIGQFVTNWNAVLAALTLAILPVLVALPPLLAAADPRHHRGSRQMTPPSRRSWSGLGQMGRSHALAYHRNPGFEIVGLVNRSTPRRCPTSSRAIAILPIFEAGAAREARPRLDQHLHRQPRRLMPSPPMRGRAPMSSSKSRWRPPSPDAERVVAAAQAQRPQARRSATSCGITRAGCGSSPRPASSGRPYVMRMNLNQQSCRRGLGDAQAR